MNRSCDHCGRPVDGAVRITEADARTLLEALEQIDARGTRTMLRALGVRFEAMTELADIRHRLEHAIEEAEGPARPT